MAQYRVYCTTENVWLPVTSLTAPTECPNNPAHTIDTNNVVMLSAIPKNIQTYQAIVAGDGSGNFLTVAAAFSAGVINALVRRGLYVETQNVVLPEGGLLMGENAGSVWLVFPGPHGVVVDGSGGTVETAGTISVASGSQLVTGTGTAFHAGMDGHFLLLDNNYYEIGAVVSATVLYLVLPYNGAAVTGAPMHAQAMLTGTSLRNLVIVQGGGPAITYRACRHGTIQDVACKYNTPNIVVESCSDIAFKNTISEASLGVGVTIRGCYNILMESLGAKNCFSHGVIIQNSCNVFIDSCSAVANGGNGMYCVGSCRVSINCGSYNANSGHGIMTDATNMGMTVLSGLIAERNAGSGVHFNDTTNMVNACVLYNNALHGIRVGNNGIVTNNHCNNNGGNGVNCDTHNDCVISGNISQANGGSGVYCDNGQRNSVLGNRVTGNAGAGVYMGPGSSINFLISNILSGNGTAPYQDLGASNTVEQNII
jgi:hypothetical protein